MNEQSNATVWFWLRPDRKQVQGSLGELRALLAGRALPRSTLVWIEPWPEWLPASRVPELAGAVPASSLAPGPLSPGAAPRPTPKSTLPPLREAAKPLAPRPEAPSNRALPPLAASRAVASAEQAGEAPRRPPRAGGPPPLPPRDARPPHASLTLPTPSEASITELPEALLIEEAAPAAPNVNAESLTAAESHVDVGQSERSPAAAHEPVAVKPAVILSEPLVTASVAEIAPEPVVAQPALEESSPSEAPPLAETATAEGLPFPPPPEPLPPPPLDEEAPLAASPATPGEPSPSVTPEASASESPSEAPALAAISELPPDSGPLKVAQPEQRSELAELLPRRVGTLSDAPVELAPREEDSLRPRRRSARATVWMFAAAWGALSLLLVLCLRPFAKRAAEPALAAAAGKETTPLPRTEVGPSGRSPTVAQEQAGPSCALTVSASKLAESAERSVLPAVVATGPHGALLGFAATPTRAQGLLLDLDSLDQTSPFEQNAERAVVRVSPSGDSAAPAFDVERDDGALKLTRALQSAPGVVLGFAGGHLVRRSNGQNDDLWAVEAEGATEPRSARINQDLEAVVFRQGGLAGKLRFGWFAPEGPTRVSALQELDAGAQQVGTPSVSANGAGALIAFAARDADSEPWRLRLSSAKTAEAAERPVQFAMPEQDFGAGAIAPSLTSLPAGRWALQWTQGTSGRYRVLVQLLGPDLKAQGPALAVSPMGANAGQGSLWAIGDRVLSLFVLPVPGKDELWGAVLECR